MESELVYAHELKHGTDSEGKMDWNRNSGMIPTPLQGKPYLDSP